MAKSRNNLLGVGGQRKKLSRTGQQGTGAARDADLRAAADQKQELLRRMRERAQNPATPEAAEALDGAASPASTAEDDAQS
ncbi:DUF6243 family protein [Streptomyces sp. NPDC058195]|uniref:DUF6243 family protein n=1 Tax=Streptomyces sp. NPDC058195 TaxID=3346375 RepID=UPI0036E23132